MRNEAVALREQSDRDSMIDGIVGASEALGKVFRQAAMVAPAGCTVWILGETGTGKELIARDPQAVQARRSGIHRCELRRYPALADCFRALRSREGRLHRCDTTAAGAL